MVTASELHVRNLKAYAAAFRIELPTTESSNTSFLPWKRCR
jgi:hypothetical protein